MNTCNYCSTNECKCDKSYCIYCEAYYKKSMTLDAHKTSLVDSIVKDFKKRIQNEI